MTCRGWVIVHAVGPRPWRIVMRRCTQLAGTCTEHGHTSHKEIAA